MHLRDPKRLILMILFLVTSMAFLHLYWLNVPGVQRVAVGDPLLSNLNLPGSIASRIIVEVSPDTEKVSQRQCKPGNIARYGLQQGFPLATNTGYHRVKLSLFGWIPIRQVTVNVVPAKSVWPGGHSIGVLLEGYGVVVIGYTAITDTDGIKSCPAREAGLVIGDKILQVDGQEIKSVQEMARLLEASDGHPVVLRIKRQKKEMNIRVNPVKCRETGKYMIGVFLRDGTAGVGTLTFYEPEAGIFGALGHIITDGDSHRPVTIDRGRIVKALIRGVQQSQRGKPGEKIGLFADEEDFTGIISKNTHFGIFGRMEVYPKNNLYDHPIPVAFATQVEPGEAEILTVVDGDVIERFSIYIDRVLPQPRSDGKGMLIRITDPRLLKHTGGIIQGMSGSPIIQNGKLAGAVTHVFVNDPARGYGVLAEWMLIQAGVWPEEGAKQTFAPSSRWWWCARHGCRLGGESPLWAWQWEPKARVSMARCGDPTQVGGTGSRQQSPGPMHQNPMGGCLEADGFATHDEIQHCPNPMQ